MVSGSGSVLPVLILIPDWHINADLDFSEHNFSIKRQPIGQNNPLVPFCFDMLGFLSGQKDDGYVWDI
jgi:hypothetical protein